MSYHVRFRLAWYGGGLDPAADADCERVLAEVAKHVRAEGTYEFGEWRAEFGKAVGGEDVVIEHLDAEWATGLLLTLSGRFPDAVFGARGVGEGLDDVWVVWARGGRVVPSRPAE